MIEDFRTVDVSVPISGDVCIVGAGAAGIVLALELSKAGLRVVLLESGDALPNHSDQILNEGEITGDPFTGLTEGRVRGLGGATRLWFGQCIRLDPIDVEQRDWVPYSGWPISSSELDAWYPGAERFFRIEGESYDDQLYRKVGKVPPLWREGELRSHFTIYTPRINLGALHYRDIKEDPQMLLLLKANVLEVTTAADGMICTGVRVASLDGKSGQVDAPVVVLCGGGIENARLLLLSRSHKKKGLGNDGDLVGRFLQDHPNAKTANVYPTNMRALHALFSLQYKGSSRYFPKFCLDSRKQEAERCLNCTSHLVFEQAEASGLAACREIYRALRRDLPVPDLGPKLLRIAKDFPSVLQSSATFFLMGKSPLGKPVSVRLQCHLEQQPDPESRVTLSQEKDPLGMPQTRVHWKVNEAERTTMRIATQTMGEELSRLGLAQVEMDQWLADDEADWKSHITDSYHHIGTTRMGANENLGVVDDNCQVFGTQGLFVAGSSVFPTSGYANPTLTIVALSLRLANHIAGMLAVSHSASSGRDLELAETPQIAAVSVALKA
jgi:choline dehydrogenase-like flavoprotein